MIECITAKSEHGFALAPNQSATKVAWLLNTVEGARDRDLCFGTVDSWIAWRLTGGAVHVTDRINAAVTGLDRRRLQRLVRRRAVGVRHPAIDAARLRRHVRVDRARPRRCTGPAAGRAGRRSAGQPDRPELRSPAATPRSRSARAACSTCAPTTARRHRRGAAQHGTFPIVAWSIGRRARRGASRRSCCRRAPTSSGCATTWDLIDDAAAQPRRRAAVRDDRRRGVRAGAARSGHAALGLRRSRLAVRPHPRHRAAARGARGARGHRPPRRRPGRGRRGRHRQHASARCASTAA